MVNSVMSGSSGFLNILNAFDKKTLVERLYNVPAVCFLSFRELPELARNIVARLLWINSGIELSSIIRGNIYGKTYAEIIKPLLELAILEETTSDNGTFYMLAETFRLNLKTALCGGGLEWLSYPPPGDVSRTAKSVEYLERYASERWECLLYSLVLHRLPENSEVSVGGISREARNLLVKAGLLQVIDEANDGITARGFQFLLLDKRSQAWLLAEALVGRDNPSTDAAVLLASVALSRPSTVEYSTSSFTSEQLSVLACLREFGFVYQRSSKLPRFYCTSLAAVLASSSTSSIKLPVFSNSRGYISVETNFRLYAYTDSRLDAALISMFAEPLCRFQNLIIAALTRDSFRKAINLGITAQQVIDFLKSRAKPETDASGFGMHSAIPPAVADQLQIWELEKCRLRHQKAFLYSNFDSSNDYTLLRDYADQIGCLLWNPERLAESYNRRQMMVVTPQGHEQLRSFWRRRRRPDNS